MTKLFRHTILLLAAVSLVAVSCKDNAIPSDTLGTDGIQQGRVAYDTIYNMREASGDTIDVEEAVRIGLELPPGGNSDSKSYTKESYYILGYVKGINEAYNASYGNITPILCNKLNNRQMLSYRLKNYKGAKFTDANQLEKGDIVVIKGKIFNRYGNPQISDGVIVTSSNLNNPDPDAPKSGE